MSTAEAWPFLYLRGISRSLLETIGITACQIPKQPWINIGRWRCDTPRPRIPTLMLLLSRLSKPSRVLYLQHRAR